MPTIENLDEKALRKAFKRLKNDTRHFERLLVRDPTDFVDFQVQLAQQLQGLKHDVEAGTYTPQKPTIHPYPKSKGINRPTVVFDVRDALVYRFCIEQIDAELVAATRRNPNIRGGVKISPNVDPSDDGYYEKFFSDWLDHNDAIREGLEARPFAASTDIASYFEGINVSLLIDFVRSTVTGKPGVVTLLDFFLRNWKVQYDYGANVETGIPQEDIDCSRTLAYFYLHPHDDRLVQFTLEHDGELFRFADDITILVESASMGRRAPKAVTESLRELGLVASIEKTEILASSTVIEELMYAENSRLNELAEPITASAKGDRPDADATAALVAVYAEWRDGAQGRMKNWRKLLGRFYTLASLARAPFLVDDLGSHIVEFPAVVHDKFAKYVVRLQEDAPRESAIRAAFDYLDSEENLYASLESALLEATLYLNAASISDETRGALGTTARGLALGTRPSLSAYARALGALMCFRFCPDAVDEIADAYLRTPEPNGLLRKYQTYVALTSDDAERRAKVLARARSDQDSSTNRLVALVENLTSAKNSSAVKAYFKRNRLYYVGAEASEEYAPVRHDVLRKLITIYG